MREPLEVDVSLVRVLVLGIVVLATVAAGDWSRFRGPNGSGVVDAGHLPSEIGPESNVVWKTPLPEGHSSPILSGDRIYLTGVEGGNRTDAGRAKVRDKGRLFTICLDLDSGEILWKREAPRPRIERYQPANSGASPSPVADSDNVYVFFGDYGLISYTADGVERWRLPLGPFNNVNGHGSSPIVLGDRLYLLCDQDTDSYFLAVEKDTGKIAWKTMRPEVTRSYSTPTVYEPENGPTELIVPGSYYLTSYSAETGEKLWWVSHMSWQPKSVPVIHNDLLIANSVEPAGAGATGNVVSFAELLEEADRDSDERVSKAELKNVRPRMRFETTDLDSDGQLDVRDWEFYVARRTARNRMVAVRLGGRGDLTDTDRVVWSLERFLPNVPSPLIYEGVLYLVKDGGILSSLDPETGEIFKQGRLGDAIDTYYASPVAADGKVYLISVSGQATVLQAGAQWEILSSSNFEDAANATPAIRDGRIYLRTKSALYCFADK